MERGHLHAGRNSRGLTLPDRKTKCRLAQTPSDSSSSSRVVKLLCSALRGESIAEGESVDRGESAEGERTRVAEGDIAEGKRTLGPSAEGE